jgi:hypothetical protein
MQKGKRLPSIGLVNSLEGRGTRSMSGFRIALEFPAPRTPFKFAF